MTRTPEDRLLQELRELEREIEKLKRHTHHRPPIVREYTEG